MHCMHCMQGRSQAVYCKPLQEHVVVEILEHLARWATLVTYQRSSIMVPTARAWNATAFLQMLFGREPAVT
jgi:hypothetical protein